MYIYRYMIYTWKYKYIHMYIYTYMLYVYVYINDQTNVVDTAGRVRWLQGRCRRERHRWSSSLRQRELSGHRGRKQHRWSSRLRNARQRGLSGRRSGHRWGSVPLRPLGFGHPRPEALRSCLVLTLFYGPRRTWRARSRARRLAGWRALAGGLGLRERARSASSRAGFPCAWTMVRSHACLRWADAAAEQQNLYYIYIYIYIYTYNYIYMIHTYIYIYIACVLWVTYTTHVLFIYVNDVYIPSIYHLYIICIWYL